jgi:chromate transport protein ChrA
MKGTSPSYFIVPCLIGILFLYFYKIENLDYLQSFNYVLRFISAVILGVFALAIGAGHAKAMFNSKEFSIYFLIALASFCYLVYLNDLIIVKYIVIACGFLLLVGFFQKKFKS